MITLVRLRLTVGAYCHRDGIMLKHIEYILALPDTDQCIPWHMSLRNGYGQVRYMKRTWYVHRLSCALHTGHCPPDMEAAHSCGNRACINPKHLSWKTRVGNQHDRITHGTHTRGENHGMSRFTEQDILSIRADMRKYQAIADDYSTTTGVISRIKTRKRWKHL